MHAGWSGFSILGITVKLTEGFFSKCEVYIKLLASCQIEV